MFSTLVLGIGRHVKHSMHNHFSRICGFLFTSNTSFAYQWISSSSILYLLFKTQLFLRMNFKRLQGKGASVFLSKSFSLTFILHYLSKSQVEVTDNVFRWKLQTNNQWCWWHLPHQDYVHQKESVSDQWSNAVPCCLFCDLSEFDSFNDPCLAHPKQDTAEYTERKNITLSPLLHCLKKTRVVLQKWFHSLDLEELGFYDTVQSSL